jgi:hypothetical protein
VGRLVVVVQHGADILLLLADAPTPHLVPAVASSAAFSSVDSASHLSPECTAVTSTTGAAVVRLQPAAAAGADVPHALRGAQRAAAHSRQRGEE